MDWTYVSESQFEALANRLRTAVDRLTADLQRFQQYAQSARLEPAATGPGIMDYVGDYVRGFLERAPDVLGDLGARALRTGGDLVNRALQVGADIIQTILHYGWWVVDYVRKVLTGLPVAWRMYRYAGDWQAVRQRASQVVSQTKLGVRIGVVSTWHGDAATAYNLAIRPQADAARYITSMCGKISDSLAVCGRSGLLYYAALLVMVIKTAVTVAAGIAALATGVLSAAGLWVIAKGLAEVVAAVVGGEIILRAYLKSEVNNFTALISDQQDFPNHQWPHATTHLATDPAGWIVRSGGHTNLVDGTR
jgi:hypothetical protein